jgi:hypothetical protein
VALARMIAELYPGTARAHTTLGVLLAETGDEKGAAAAYAKALEVDGRETRALDWRRRLSCHSRCAGGARAGQYHRAMEPPRRIR